jgi:hypothetical protein
LTQLTAPILRPLIVVNLNSLAKQDGSQYQA